MTKFKIQREKGVVLALKHFDFNCHLDFGIWNLANGIATHFSPVVARHDSAEAISVCPPVVARHDRAEAIPAG